LTGRAAGTVAVTFRAGTRFGLGVDCASLRRKITPRPRNAATIIAIMIPTIGNATIIPMSPPIMKTVNSATQMDARQPRPPLKNDKNTATPNGLFGSVIPPPVLDPERAD
jgi:hypothetical protein